MSLFKSFNLSYVAIHAAWLILVFATLIAWWLGHGVKNTQENIDIAVAGIIGTAFIKVWIVGLQFMELRYAPRWLRISFNLWVIAISMIIVMILFL